VGNPVRRWSELRQGAQAMAVSSMATVGNPSGSAVCVPHHGAGNRHSGLCLCCMRRRRSGADQAMGHHAGGDWLRTDAVAPDRVDRHLCLAGVDRFLRPRTNTDCSDPRLLAAHRRQQLCARPATAPGDHPDYPYREPGEGPAGALMVSQTAPRSATALGAALPGHPMGYNPRCLSLAAPALASASCRRRCGARHQ
jgi:hypothetical protein